MIVPLIYSLLMPHKYIYILETEDRNVIVVDDTDPEANNTVEEPAHTVEQVADTVEEPAHTVEQVADTVEEPAHTVEQAADTVEEEESCEMVESSVADSADEPPHSGQEEMKHSPSPEGEPIVILKSLLNIPRYLPVPPGERNERGQPTVAVTMPWKLLLKKSCKYCMDLIPSTECPENIHSYEVEFTGKDWEIFRTFLDDELMLRTEELSESAILPHERCLSVTNEEMQALQLELREKIDDIYEYFIATAKACAITALYKKQPHRVMELEKSTNYSESTKQRLAYKLYQAAVLRRKTVTYKVRPTNEAPPPPSAFSTAPASQFPAMQSTPQISSIQLPPMQTTAPASQFAEMPSTAPTTQFQPMQMQLPPMQTTAPASQFAEMPSTAPTTQFQPMQMQLPPMQNTAPASQFAEMPSTAPTNQFQPMQSTAAQISSQQLPPMQTTAPASQFPAMQSTPQISSIQLPPMQTTAPASQFAEMQSTAPTTQFQPMQSTAAQISSIQLPPMQNTAPASQFAEMPSTAPTNQFQPMQMQLPPMQNTAPASQFAEMPSTAPTTQFQPMQMQLPPMQNTAPASQFPAMQSTPQISSIQLPPMQTTAPSTQFAEMQSTAPTTQFPPMERTAPTMPAGPEIPATTAWTMKATDHAESALSGTKDIEGGSEADSADTIIMSPEKIYKRLV